MFIIYIIYTYIVTFGKYLKKIQNAIISVIFFKMCKSFGVERMKQMESRKIKDKCVFVTQIVECDISTMIVR